jgi:hypothetical protein
MRSPCVAGGEVVEDLPVGEHPMYTFGRSLTCDFQLEHPSASRQHAVLVHHENGGLYAIDLKSSHGTAVNEKPIKPHEACRVREGAVIRFGASSRTYRLSLKAVKGGGSAWEEEEAEEAEDEPAAGSKRPFAPPMHKKKWWPPLPPWPHACLVARHTRHARFLDPLALLLA